MRNIIGQAVVGDDLYGRAYELGRLWELLEQGQHILMLAPRRVGKTSLMLELRRKPRENWDVFYVDVEGGEGPADCVASILAALAAAPRYRTRFEAIPFSNAVKNVLTRFTSVAVNIDVLRVELKGAMGREWGHAADQLQARLASFVGQRCRSSDHCRRVAASRFPHVAVRQRKTRRRVAALAAPSLASGTGTSRQGSYAGRRFDRT